MPARAPAGKIATKIHQPLAGTRRERISQLLKRIEEQLNIQDMKITLSDFIRLTQLERELEQQEQPREIIITWKDPSETSVG